jgi:small conductance mechanosensitive channel
VRLLIMGDPGPPSERLAREADLRATALSALRGAGVR